MYSMIEMVWDFYVVMIQSKKGILMIRWKTQDRDHNPIYLSQERWEHIIEPINHPEMVAYESHLQYTIQQGKRKQDQLNPQKYRYSQAFDDLVEDNTHVVAIALFRFRE